MMETGHRLPPLPPPGGIETPKVLRQLVRSHRYLAELKGTAKTIPNESILLGPLTLREAKDSSEVENIVTSHDELFRESISVRSNSPAAKEVLNYAKGLRHGFGIVRQEGMLLNRHIIEVQGILEGNRAGFRTQAGTRLVNNKGEVVYTPPQDAGEILDLMANLERFMNDSALSDLDPLVKMAVIHYQFESIHPFYDGNGRTGRIVNILYLVMQGLLDFPVLYLSRYIIRNKAAYYGILQDLRTKGDWEGLVLYFLHGVEEISRETTQTVLAIKGLMQEYKNRLRRDLPKLYSQDLLNILFREPYTKAEFLERELMVSIRTARNYLMAIAELGLLESVRVWKTDYYINKGLSDLLSGSRA